MARFVPVDRDTQFLFPPSVQEWLPKDHLARFVVDVVEQLDLSELEQSYAGRGSDAHHPGMLVALLTIPFVGYFMRPPYFAFEFNLNSLFELAAFALTASRPDRAFPTRSAATPAKRTTPNGRSPTSSSWP